MTKTVGGENHDRQKTKTESKGKIAESMSGKTTTEKRHLDSMSGRIFFHCRPYCAEKRQFFAWEEEGGVGRRGRRKRNTIVRRLGKASFRGQQIPILNQEKGKEGMTYHRNGCLRCSNVPTIG